MSGSWPRPRRHRQPIPGFTLKIFLDKQSRFLIFEKSMFYNLEVFIFLHFAIKILAIIQVEHELSTSFVAVFDIIVLN